MLSEEEECKILVDWMDARGLLYTHVPNGGKRHPGVARKLKRIGTKPGVPDYLIFNSPPALDTYGVAIEMKRKKGGRLSDPQKYWISALLGANWSVIVANGADKAIIQLMAMGF